MRLWSQLVGLVLRYEESCGEMSSQVGRFALTTIFLTAWRKALLNHGLDYLTLATGWITYVDIFQSSKGQFCFLHGWWIQAPKQSQSSTFYLLGHPMAQPLLLLLDPPPPPPQGPLPFFTLPWPLFFKHSNLLWPLIESQRELAKPQQYLGFPQRVLPSSLLCSTQFLTLKLPRRAIPSIAWCGKGREKQRKAC